VYIFYEYQNEFPFTSIPKGTFNEDYTKFIAACLISILEYLHSKDIAYRGLNPHYIALKPSGYPVLTSYSPAVIIKPGIFSLSMPQLGVYSAPELSDQKYSKAVDLWSLGIIIYQCLYGTLPFELKENDSFETIYSKTNAKRLIFPNNTNFFKAEELLNVLLSTDPKLRTTVKDIKYMKWFSSIDWQRISLETYSAAFIPSFKEEKKKKTLVSLKKYMHVIKT
jgi:serine/threonine protein kinase